MMLHHNVDPIRGWQWIGQPHAEWPSWVQRTCQIINGYLVHDATRGGRQVLYIGEWLTETLDGEQVFYGDAEITKGFTK